MKALKALTISALAFDIAYEQVTGHGHDHIPEEGGAPEPDHVIEVVANEVTTNFTPSQTVNTYGYPCP